MKDQSLLAKVENWFKYQADYAKPVPWIWYLLIALIAGWVIPVVYVETFNLFDEIGLTKATMAAIFFLVIDFLFVYVSIWVLTYFHYRRFMTTRKGLNFFTSKFFRFEQITVYIVAAFCIYISIEDLEPFGIYLIGMFWTSVMVPLYFLEWLFRARNARHNSTFYPAMGKGSDYRAYNKRRDWGKWKQ